MVEVVALPSIDSRELDESRFHRVLLHKRIRFKRDCCQGVQNRKLERVAKVQRGSLPFKIKKVASKGGRLSL